MYNIHITGVKGYSYTGYILDSELTDSQLETIGLKRDEYQNEIPVEGDFYIDGDDDIPMPQIENCQVLGALNGKTWSEFYTVSFCELDAPSARRGMTIVKSECRQVPAKYTLDLDVEQLNLEAMENEVSKWDDGNWAVDRLSSQIDADYDSYMDR